MKRYGFVLFSIGAGLCAGCTFEELQPDASGRGGSTATGGVKATPGPGGGISISVATGGVTAIPPTSLGAPCAPDRTVQSDGAALLERDPDVLARFPLERVLDALAASSGATTPPLEQLQRLFDTENARASAAFRDNVHCDDPANMAFRTNPASYCPRAEGALASSRGLLAPGDLDYFAPVAIVNRFDLAAGQVTRPFNMLTCGEYRIVYAKRSGRIDLGNRLFLIFEGMLPSPSSILGSCRPVAELWASQESDPSPESRGRRLETLFFGGLATFRPVLDARNFGVGQGLCEGDAYSTGLCGGQIRVGQGMQAPWEFRQFRLTTVTATTQSLDLRFVPVPDTDAPRPALFDALAADASSQSFRASDLLPALSGLMLPLARTRLGASMEHNLGDVALEGPTQPSYVLRAYAGTAGDSGFLRTIQASLGAVQPEACAADPLTPADVLNRVTALTCAGCHAPDRLLVPSRDVGCGETWPMSLGSVHIDEFGFLSPALEQLFLPHRADVLQTYLRACDEAAAVANVHSVPAPEVWDEGGGP